MTPSETGLDILVKCMRLAWEGEEGAASCASRFLGSVASAEQDEQLCRLLSFVEALRTPLAERLEGYTARQGDESMVEEASRKRGRGDAEIGQEGGSRGEPQEARRGARAKEVDLGLPGQADTAAAAAPELADGAVHAGMLHCVKDVLLDRDLLGCVWGYVLGGTGRQDMRVLGQLSVVCRKWREVSLCDAWWGAIEQDMLSVLWEEKEEEGKASNSRGRVAQYGRFLVGQRTLFRELNSGGEWLEQLQGHVEVFDRMDGLQLWSMRGAFSLMQINGTITMGFAIDEPPHRFKQGASFSAASRDPLGRFSSIKEYLESGHKEEYPCCLCIRVTLRDMRTGKMAIIWEEGKSREREIEYVDEDEDERDKRDLWLLGRQWQRQENLLGRLMRQESAYLYIGCSETRESHVSEHDLNYLVEGSANFELLFTGVGGKTLTMEQFEGALKAALYFGS